MLRQRRLCRGPHRLHGKAPPGVHGALTAGRPMREAEMAGDIKIIDPEVARFVEYWKAKRGDGRYPTRAALDPLEFRYVLGDVVLIEAQRRPPAGDGDDKWD